MIPLRRLPEPPVLGEHAAEWTERYLARREQSPKLRPPNGQYGHRAIRDVLAAMSHSKCFYCEGQPSRLTVDHHIEVEEAPERSFDWNNLYLACDDCQGKLKNRSIPVSECVDPCSSFDPDEHFVFDDELMRWRSSRGERTVCKYRLNSDLYSGRRAKASIRFYQVLQTILRRQLEDQREHMLPEELEALRRFAAPDWPYSLMFRSYLRRNGLLPTDRAPSTYP